MQKLQLYINDERIDLFKDEQVSISLSQQDVKDPAKIFAYSSFDCIMLLLNRIKK